VARRAWARSARDLGLGRIPTHDPAATAEAALALVGLDRLCKQVPLEAPWTAARASAWDAMTFQTWMDHGDTAIGYPYGGSPSPFPGLRTAGARKLLELAVESVFSAEPRDLSFLHALFYFHSAGSVESLINTTGGAQQDRVVGGSQLLSIGQVRRAAREGVRLDLSSPVRRIDHRGWPGAGGGRRLRGPLPQGRLRDPADPGRPDRLQAGASRYATS